MTESVGQYDQKQTEASPFLVSCQCLWNSLWYSVLARYSVVGSERINMSFFPFFPSIHPFFHPYSCLCTGCPVMPIYPPPIHPSIHAFTCLSIHHSSSRPPTHPSIHPSIHHTPPSHSSQFCLMLSCLLSTFSALVSRLSSSLQSSTTQTFHLINPDLVQVRFLISEGNQRTNHTAELRTGVLVEGVGVINYGLQINLILHCESFSRGQEVLVHVPDHLVTLQTGQHTGQRHHEGKQRGQMGSHLERDQATGGAVCLSFLRSNRMFVMSQWI